MKNELIEILVDILANKYIKNYAFYDFGHS